MLFSLISSRSSGVLWIVGSSSTSGKFFSWNSSFGFAKSYFSSIFRIFIGLFKLDMLL